MSPPDPAGTHSIWKKPAAFLIVYLVWGSTYLAIKWGVASIPPFLLAGMRFLLAGSVLVSWTRWSGAPRPKALHWRSAAIAGALLLLGGNGCVVWAARRMDSGVSSLFIAITPLWMVLLDWRQRSRNKDGRRPSVQVFAGLLFGFLGLALLLNPFQGERAAAVDPLGAAMLILATLSWSVGSIYARSAPLPASPFLSAGMEQIAGGALLLVTSLLAGEPIGFDPASITLRSWLCFAYLMTIGSLVAFTAYVWLLQATTPAKVATYAYVNPLVAVFLGWALNGERLDNRTLLAAAVIIAAVAAITLDGLRKRPDLTRPAAPEPAQK